MDYVLGIFFVEFLDALFRRTHCGYGMLSPCGIEQKYERKGLALPQSWNASDVSPPGRSRWSDFRTRQLSPLSAFLRIGGTITFNGNRLI